MPRCGPAGASVTGPGPPLPRSRPYENSFVTGVPVTTRDGRAVKSS
jgi:hypothetical protein